MQAAQSGEIWTVQLDSIHVNVRILGQALGNPAWLRCSEVRTGIEFDAPQRWLLARCTPPYDAALQ